MRIKAAIFSSLLFCVSVVYGDQTVVAFDSGSKSVYDQNTAASNALTGGTSADGDGAVLQLGYYSNASTADNFAGTWIPLSGETSLNTAIISGSSPPEGYNKTSIGDITSAGAGNATFAMSLTFVAGSATSGNNLPSSTTIPLALRFYNATSIATSTFYNVVSDDAWLWKAPIPNSIPNTVAITLDETVPALEWQSIAVGQAANTAFHTTIPLSEVPEPSTIVAGLACAFGLVLRTLRQRKKVWQVPN